MNQIISANSPILISPPRLNLNINITSTNKIKMPFLISENFI